MFGDEATALRDAGGEYGAATGRPRRVGGFDVVASRYGVKMQGCTSIALTKLDVLSYLDKIPVCVAYDIDGERVDRFPIGVKLAKAKPIYELSLIHIFAGAVDTGKRLFMQQADHAVARGHLLHDLHRQLVLVSGDVAGRKHGRKLMLRGSDLVVLGLGVDAELPELLIEILHECRNARLDAAEIVIVKLLPLRRLCTEERTPGIDPVSYTHLDVYKRQHDGREGRRKGHT